MKTLVIFSYMALFFLLYNCLFSQLYASALIEVDSAQANVGVILRENTDTVRHIFNIKNTGDDTLKIVQVKPDCGCAVLKYDSIILPGNSGCIEETIRLDNFFVGIFTKNIDVISNAENDKKLRLTLKGKLQSVISPSHEFLQLYTRQDTTVNGHITFTTDYRELRIEDLYFKEPDKNKENPRNHPLISILYEQTPVHLENQRLYAFRINFTFKNLHPEKRSGYYFFQTNHPKKKLVKIGGVIIPFEK